MRVILTLFLAFTFSHVHSQCWASDLKQELKTNKDLSDAIKNDKDKSLVDSWKALYEAGEDNLTERLGDIKLVDDHLTRNPEKSAFEVTQEIQDAPGGFGNWKNYDLEYTYREVEIVDAGGNPLGEFDGIDTDRKAFIEDKSALGLNNINPNTGQPYQTPAQWSKKQIHDKTVVRIENLNNNAAQTRSTSGGSSTVPDLNEIKDFKTLHFRINSDDPALISSVQQELANLKMEYPDWDFTVQFGQN